MSVRLPSHALTLLLHPGEHLRSVLLGLAAAVVTWSFALGAGSSLSNASLLAFGIALAPVSIKWWRDVKRWGVSATALSVLLVLQGLHTFEHVAQGVQYYLLGWPASRSLGLVTAANAEWLHFAWNWLIFAGIVFVFRRGLKNVWMYALLGWALLHGLEHSYLLVRYFRVVNELSLVSLTPTSVTQSLPGILGKDGLLALASWCGSIPGITTAPRVAVHFWWNFGELSLLVLAARAGAENLFASNLIRSNPSKLSKESL